MQPNWFVGLKAVSPAPLRCPPLAEGMQLLHLEDYHVTVAFFGKLADDPTPLLAEMLHRMRRPRLSATAVRAVLLPRPAWASVVALCFGEGNAELCSFIATWRDQLRQQLGLEPESRSVLPHLTVVRMKPNQMLGASRQEWATALQQQLPHRFEFVQLGLYTWNERAAPSEPRYRMTVSVDLL